MTVPIQLTGMSYYLQSILYLGCRPMAIKRFAHFPICCHVSSITNV